MTTDIIKRLRSNAAERREQFGHSKDLDLLGEAADEIEELREALRLTGRALAHAVEDINYQLSPQAERACERERLLPHR